MKRPHLELNVPRSVSQSAESQMFGISRLFTSVLSVPASKDEHMHMLWLAGLECMRRTNCSQSLLVAVGDRCCFCCCS